MRWLLGLLLVLGVHGSADAEELDNDTCLACHGEASADRFVDPAKFVDSVHGSLACTNCHAEITAIPHEMPLPSVRWQQIPSTCGQCHTEAHEAYQRGIHGQAVAAGRRGAPVCTDCHSAHAIQSPSQASSTVSAAHIPETCGQCHAAERITTKYRLPSHVVATYMESFHGLAMQLGSVTVANCASCHGPHGILPSSDPQSSVHPNNLPTTCGQCHAGVSAQVTKGRIHTAATPTLEHEAITWVRGFYWLLIAFTIGGMLLHNGLDFWKKLCAHYQRMAAAGTPRRMTLNERLQHGCLILAFVTLAFTGFALKFPQAWWASPFVGHFDWRSMGHRAAAVVFVLLSAYHVVFMVGTKRGRHELKALWPRRRDAVQPFQMLGYYLGMRRERPVMARYSYIEKLEYWALVWGSIIMTVTGVLMVYRGWTMRALPKWAFDVLTTVHFYEAILACLAILIWHLYFVMFDPDEYPMKWTWVTGHASAADTRHRASAHPRSKPPAADPPHS